MNKFVLAIAVIIVTGCGTETPTGTSTEEKGDIGPQGPAGPVGPKGDKGDKGIAGPAGPNGNTGPAGSAGIQGPQGVSGSQGIPGPVGITGPQGPQGAIGPVGARGPIGDMGLIGPQGPRGLTGAAGSTIAVIDKNGNTMGNPIPWLDGTNDLLKTAIFMNTENPSPTFPQGYILPTDSPSDIFYVVRGCIGTPMADTFIHDVMFDNFLYWVPNYNVLYKRIGSVASSANGRRSRITGQCSDVFINIKAFIRLEDTGFRLDMGNTRPWTMVVQ